jgi:hypothetical protein
MLEQKNIFGANKKKKKILASFSEPTTDDILNSIQGTLIIFQLNFKALMNFINHNSLRFESIISRKLRF